MTSPDPTTLPIDRMPAPLGALVRRGIESEVGGFALRLWHRLLAIEVFDRSMSIAAQFFTSLIPLSIALGAAFGRDWQISSSLELPPEAAEAVENAVTGSGASTGLIGLVLILVLATSLSRTLTRLYCAVFAIPKPPTSLGLAARWLIAVACFFLAVVLARIFRLIVQGLPFDQVWFVIGGIAVLTVLWVLVPWLLVEGRIGAWNLLPGAAIVGTAWIAIGAISNIALGPILTRSAAQYGVMGVAFTYLSWLYFLSLALVVAVVLGYELLPRRTRLELRASAASRLAEASASTGDLGRD